MRAVCLLVGLTAIGCGESATASLEHQAYVWQRDWSGPVSDAVERAPAALSGLRVLAMEVSAAGAVIARPAVDVGALARSRRAVTAVARIDGARPIASITLEPLLEQVARWRQRGVRVRGIEIDHDCGTAHLAAYARWLQRRRPPPALRWSITALPTWAGSRHLRSVVESVDEVVVQVHAVEAPRLFEPHRARRWLERFATAATGRSLWVALPTYRVVVGGQPLAADPVELAGFVTELRRRPVPGLRGVAWFRLPVIGDPGAWSAATMTAVIAQRPLAPQVSVRLRRKGSAIFDVELHNRGNTEGAWPGIGLRGDIQAADLIAGYLPRGHKRWRAPKRRIPPGQVVVVGWVRGENVDVHAW